MIGKPKPLKSDREKTSADKKASLRDYRRVQAAKAILRDNDQCAICHFLHNRYRPRQDVHHVYGRARVAGHPREHFSNLLCVCRECHPPPIRDKGGNAALKWVEDVLYLANEIPINEDFKEQ